MALSDTAIGDLTVEIPGYSVISELGQGGMAAVYLAVQECFGRKVALKIMSPHLAIDPTFGERFQREAKIVARLSHPHIVAVYDVGVVENHHYIAMEYHCGGDLKARISAGLTLPETMLILKQVALALDFAHSKGYIHRDVKPDNILFREDGAAVLTDFGIARPTKTSQQMTQAGKVVGTPKYMSPEQAKGQELDARADLYALGVLFYEMLLGRVPFEGDDPIAIGIQHVKDPPPPLPDHLAQFQPVMDKLLAKEPQDRYQRGQAVIKALETVEIETSGHIVRAEIDTLTPTPEQNNPIRAHAESIRADLEGRAFSSESGPPQRSQLLGIGAAFGIVVVLCVGAVVMAPTLFPKVQPLMNLHQKWVGKPASKPSIKAPLTAKAADEPSITNLADNQPSAIVKVSSLAPEAVIVKPNEIDNEIASREDEAPSNTPRPASSVSIDAAPTTAEPIAENQLAQSEAADEPEASQVTAAPPAIKPEPEPEPKQDPAEVMIKRLLLEADEALAQNNLSKPVDNNALDKYRAVLAIQAKQPDALVGVHNIATAYIDLSKKALAKENIKTAKAHLQRAKEIRPQVGGAPSLAVAIKKVEKKKALERLAAEKLAVEEEAKRLKAEKYRQDDNQAKLMLNKVRISALLRSAQNDLTRDQLTTPSGENAYEKYQLILDLDPQNEDAHQGLRNISDALIERIQQALSVQDYPGAKDFLIQTIKVNPDHPQLPELRQTIQELGI